MNKTDVAIVGGGIIGLAHAYAAWKKGYQVVLFEKDETAVGASVRNFGLIWPIGQPQGKLFERAIRSREIWLKLAVEADFWALQNGSLHLAYHQDEMDVLNEYHQKFGFKTSVLNPIEVQTVSSISNSKGLLGGLFSELEVNVNPREAVSSITDWLRAQDSVTIITGEKVVHTETGRLTAVSGEWQADMIYICSGSDFQSLYSNAFRSSGLIKSKLQMMKAVSSVQEVSKGPTLCGGLTLKHYQSFAECQGTAKLIQRLNEELPLYHKYGIHVMISKNQAGEWIIGDSHEYGLTFDPFNKADINKLILDYLSGFCTVAGNGMKITETWYGVYAKNPAGTEYTFEPETGVKIVTGFGGAGMTFSFGFAEEEIEKL